MPPFLYSGSYASDFYEEPERIKYWVYVVLNEIYEDFDDVEQFKRLVLNFGKKFDDTVKIVLPIKSRYEKTRRSVLKKAWNDKTRTVLEHTQDPYWLVLRESLRRFQPSRDEFGLIWFPDAINHPAQYLPMFGRMEKQIKHGKDLLNWVKHHNRRTKYQLAFNKLYSSLELKPGAFGFAIDLKALLASEESESKKL